MKPNLWIFSIEPIDTRYTGQWFTHVPKLLGDRLGDKYNVKQINGVQKNTEPTPGAFLNFSDTNYWKSSQLLAFLDKFNEREFTPNDYFLFTDAWNPVCVQIKYMGELLGFNWKMGGLWHAGSYDPADFLGRLIGNAPWVRHAEKSFFNCYDHNYFATDFHICMFVEELLGEEVRSARMRYIPSGKIVRTGWPMEYLSDTLSAYKSLPKKDLILFPHRIAPEKQVNIFLDLKKELPEYEFVVCQDTPLTKHEYHTLLGQSKMVFSASNQETLGIGWMEGVLVGSMPLVPDRLSYREMGLECFKYQSKMTTTWDNYQQHKPQLIEKIKAMMSTYTEYLPSISKQQEMLEKKFFSADDIIRTISAAVVNTESHKGDTVNESSVNRKR